ncbi:MAG: PQQ-dependent sugar dehydrogenase [Candidatus Thiodiazotropha sp. (ex Monitilora ramsayi)]|nr:PQQ-dependent sugar dehydrogenase [Candidatus Thiodiazotropha sp. (ex Monitilora ramsayi)]
MAAYTLFSLIFPTLACAAATIETEKHSITYQIVTSGLSHPWSLAFLPDGRFLVTERNGQLKRVDTQGNQEKVLIEDLSPIEQHGQGGLLDVVLHPDFKDNRWVYLSFAEKGKGGYGTAVARGKLIDNRINGAEVIFRMAWKTHSTRHFGSRLIFDNEGFLYITLGDRGDRPRAQDLGDHAGSLIRLHDDGSIPKDNPFAGRLFAKKEIYSYGHRNIQGAAIHPDTGELWIHEHGPQGGDEINIPLPGKNYGWPIITYGANYGTGTKIGEGTHKTGMEQPVYHWTPSIAPSGMAFYDADRFSHWKGSLFVGSLKFRLLTRLELDGEQVIHEERLLSGELGRIRDVRQGPDGLLYLLTDDDNGKLVRVLPSPDR